MLKLGSAETDQSDWPAMTAQSNRSGQECLHRDLVRRVEGQHDHELGEIFTFDSARRRKGVTSSRGALNGYQKGRCFYCAADLRLLGEDFNTDVDHFFPHKLKQLNLHLNLDGVWNLVLACQSCNRGPRGKFDRIPSLRLLERLHTRNEFLIGSHHPLRETLMNQTGQTLDKRVDYLSKIYNKVQLNPDMAWEPENEFANLFPVLS